MENEIIKLKQKEIQLWSHIDPKKNKNINLYFNERKYSTFLINNNGRNYKWNAI